MQHVSIYVRLIIGARYRIILFARLAISLSVSLRTRDWGVGETKEKREAFFNYSTTNATIITMIIIIIIIS